MNAILLPVTGVRMPPPLPPSQRGLGLFERERRPRLDAWLRFDETKHPRGKTSEKSTGGSFAPGEEARRNALADKLLTDPEAASKHTHEKLALVEKYKAEGLETRHTFRKPGSTAEHDYTPERRAEQEALLADRAASFKGVPRDKIGIIMAGPPGAGKTSILKLEDGPLKELGHKREDFFNLNADDVKEAMAARGMVPKFPGLDPMEAAGLIHEESSYLAKVELGRVLRTGQNVIVDITMGGDPKKAQEKYVDKLKDAGYDVHGVLVNTTIEGSLASARKRYINGIRNKLGGRLVPSGAITENRDRRHGTKNRRNFRILRRGGAYKKWYEYDNSVHGRPPKLLTSWNSRGEED